MVMRILAVVWVASFAACTSSESAEKDAGSDSTDSLTDSNSESTTDTETASETDSDSTSETNTEINTDVDTSCDGIVQIPDPSFKMILLDMLDKPLGSDVTSEELSQISTFSWSHFVGSGCIDEERIVHSLIGSQCMTSLQHFDFECTAVTDLRPLANLPSLKRLFLNINRINDLSTLFGTSHLTVLEIEDGPLVDTNTLSLFASIKRLNLSYHHNLTDLSGLASLGNLESLALTSNNVSDLSPLSSLTQLKELYLDYTNVTDLTPLANAALLEKLTAINAHLQSLDGLEGCVALKELDVRTNQSELASASALAGLKQLIHVDLGGNAIDDIAFLATVDWPDLEFLSLWANQLDDFAPLVANTATFHAGVEVELWENPADCTVPEQAAHINALKARGVIVDIDCE